VDEKYIEELGIMASANRQSEGFLTLLHKRNFLLLWLAQLISMTILNASNYALIILIENVSKSTTLVGLVIIVFSLPAVIFGAPAGVLVDRLNKRRVLFYSNCLRAIVTFGFVVSLLINHTQLLPAYLLTFLISGIGQFFTPAEGSAIPQLVSEDELMHALSLFQVTFMLSNALGFIIFAPILLGVLPTFTLFHQVITPIVSLYFIMGVLYVICGLLISLIPAQSLAEPVRKRVVTASLSAESLNVWQNVGHEMLQAWTFVRRRPRLFEAIVQLSFAGVLLSVIGELGPKLVTDLLRLPTDSMAFVFAPAGIGLILSSLVMPRVVTRLGKSRTILTGCGVLAVLVTLLPLSTNLAYTLEARGMPVETLDVVVVAIIMFLAGLAISFINIPANTEMQERTPDWIKGRVLALQMMLFNGSSIPIILLIGAIADRFQLPAAIYCLAISIAIFGCWCVFYEGKSHPRQDEEEKRSQKDPEPERIVS
jgi:MFS family permease